MTPQDYRRHHDAVACPARASWHAGRPPDRGRIRTWLGLRARGAATDRRRSRPDAESDVDREPEQLSDAGPDRDPDGDTHGDPDGDADPGAGIQSGPHARTATTAASAPPAPATPATGADVDEPVRLVGVPLAGPKRVRLHVDI